MANRYWVGGASSWNTTNTLNWATTSGGAGGASVPTAADSVFFDSNSGSFVGMAVSSAVCLDLTISVSGGTFLGGATPSITISGSLFLASNTTFSSAISFTFNATSTGKTITSNGNTIGGTVAFSGTGGGWSLQDDFATSSTMTFTAGTLNLNNFNVTCLTFSWTSSTARTLTSGTGQFNVTGNAQQVLGLGTVTNLTLTTTPTFNLTYSGATGTRSIGMVTTGASETTVPNINITAGTDTFSIGTNSGGVLGTLNFTGFSGTWAAFTTNSPQIIYGSLITSATMTIPTTANALQFSSTTGTKTLNSNGQTWELSITINGVGGTLQLASAITFGATRVLTHTNGTLDLNGKTLNLGTAAGAYTTATGTKNITFNGGTIIVPGTNTTAFNNAVPTNFTTTAGAGGNGTISFTGATAKTFITGGSTYAATINQGGAGALTISGGSATFASISTTSVPSTISFPTASATNVTNFTATGTAGNLLTLKSNTGGTTATINYTGLSYVNVNYLSVTDIAFTPAATTTGTVPYRWYIGSGSSVSNTTGYYLNSYAGLVYAISSTSTTTWTVPTDWNNANNSIEAIGGGGGGAASTGAPASATGGGGGAYAKVTNLPLTPGAVISLSIAAATANVGGTGQVVGITGNDTWFNGATFAASSVGAKGGSGGNATATGTAAAASGGVASASIGTTKYNGGNSGSVTTGTNANATGGGGGAGKNGAGSNGVSLTSTSNSVSAGGQGDVTSGGTGGAGNAAGNGGSGNVGNEYTTATGSGGGGGATGSTTGIGGLGGNYGGGGGGGSNVSVGAGGGGGAQGLIIIIYNPATSKSGFFMFM